MELKSLLNAIILDRDFEAVIPLLDLLDETDDWRHGTTLVAVGYWLADIEAIHTQARVHYGSDDAYWSAGASELKRIENRLIEELKHSFWEVLADDPIAAIRNAAAYAAKFRPKAATQPPKVESLPAQVAVPQRLLDDSIALPGPSTIGGVWDKFLS